MNPAFLAVCGLLGVEVQEVTGRPLWELDVDGAWWLLVNTTEVPMVHMPGAPRPGGAPMHPVTVPGLSVVVYRHREIAGILSADGGHVVNADGFIAACVARMRALWGSRCHTCGCAAEAHGVDGEERRHCQSCRCSQYKAAP